MYPLCSTSDFSHPLCQSSSKQRKIAAYKFRNTELAIHTLPDINAMTQKRILKPRQKEHELHLNNIGTNPMRQYLSCMK